MSANSRPVRDSANAIGAGTNRPIRTQTMWHVKGETPRGWKEMRVEAHNADAAIAIAHARNIRVDTCTQIPSTRK